MEKKKFQRRKEDFFCEKCGAEVLGSGYTNHCPKCLWSKHVDINPGDREEVCQGMMEPIKIEFKNGRYFVLHRCLECGKEKFNNIGDEDDFDKVVDLVGGS
jgi:DNA-directed RNA polymerase subunit RPC12/RpoP